MMDNLILLLQIFGTFFVIGMFTFGGGYAVISLIQSEIVFGRGWITESCFTDIAAISQMTPGPIGLNCSTYVGYEVLKANGAGMWLATLGSLTSSLAIVLPSFLIMLAIVRFYTKYRQNNVFQGVLSSLKPAIAGLIGAAGLVLMFNFSPEGGFSLVAENFPDWKSWALFTAAGLVSIFAKADPVLLILAGALAGLIIY